MQFCPSYLMASHQACSVPIILSNFLSSLIAQCLLESIYKWNKSHSKTAIVCAHTFLHAGQVLHAVHLTLLIQAFKSPIKSHCDRHYGIIPECFGPVGPPASHTALPTVGLLLSPPAAAWLGLGEPSRLVGRLLGLHRDVWPGWVAALHHCR